MSPMQSRNTGGIGPNPKNAANGVNGTTTAITTTDSVANNKEFRGRLGLFENCHPVGPPL
jgi:hypothetical protein